MLVSRCPVPEIIHNPVLVSKSVAEFVVRYPVVVVNESPYTVADSNKLPYNFNVVAKVSCLRCIYPQFLFN